MQYLKKIRIDKEKFKKTKSIKRFKRKFKIFNFFLIFFSLLILFFSLGFLSFYSKINISEIKVKGNETISSQEIVSFVNKEISGKKWFLFSKKNYFLISSKEISKALTNFWINIEKVNLKKENFNTLLIEIFERKPYFLACNKEKTNEETNKTDKNEEDCFLGDKNGFIFKKAFSFSEGIYFKIFFKNKINLGEKIIEKEKLYQLINFARSLERLNVFVTGVFEENNDYHFLMKKYYNMKKNPEIIISNQNNLEEVLENLTIALNTEPFSSSFKKDYFNLEYIDLRFKDKVYYKFKDEHLNS